MKRLFLIFCLFLAGQSAFSQTSTNIIPQPLSVEKADGTFVWGEKYNLRTFNINDNDAQQFITLIDELSGCKGILTKNVESVKTDAKYTEVIIRKAKNGKGLFENKEAYELKITPNKITIEASDNAGLFYAIQSLAQLGKEISVMTIKDSPRFAYRGLMLDVSRHFFSKDFIKKQIKALAWFKLNRLHLHLTDAAGWRLEIKQYPELTKLGAWRTSASWKKWWNEDGRLYKREGDKDAYGGYFTQEEMKEIIKCASDNYITIIPEIEFPGHSEEVMAAYPNLSCAGEPYKQGEFCAGNDDVFVFAENVLKEVIELFPSEYIHIGGDEVNKSAWEKCPKCQARMKAEGLKDVDELQSYFIKRLEKILQKYNRKLLGWDEILEGGLAPNATVMSWRGEEGGIAAAKSGHHAIMTPGKYCYIDSYQDAPLTQPEAIGGYLPLESVYKYNPVPDTLYNLINDYILGVQGNLWAEYVPTEKHSESMIYPRILAVAEIGWTADSLKNWVEFKRKALIATENLRNNGYNAFDLKNEFGNRTEYYTEVNHIARGKKVTYNLPYHQKYVANGDKTLTDGVRGGWTYGDNRWQGFIGKGRFDVIIDLEKVEDITEIKADFMQSPGPEVYLPGFVEISISEDGKNYKPLQKIDYPASKKEQFGFKSFGWNGTAKARYIRYKANCGNVGGWLFVDEIIVLGKKQPADYVNTFIGTTNFGTCNPGAIVPHGLMSAVPFNVMGSDKNKFDKDNRWWSTPYDNVNSYFTGYSHVNLSGVGCPDLGSLLVMPTMGDLDVDYRNYGSSYRHEVSTPGYYSNILGKYDIKTEVTATARTSIEKYTFKKGQANILLNLGEGLTNESGATVRFVSPQEIEGSKLLGTFCYSANSVFPIYFVMRVNKTPDKYGYWKKQRQMTAEAEWDNTAGKYKIYPSYHKVMSGDDIGTWMSFNTNDDDEIEVRIGVSFVSIENARENLNKEQGYKSEKPSLTFEQAKVNARDAWNKDLSGILVEGGTDEQKTVFYTALYHMLIHPNVLQDVNGEYPMEESNEIGKTNANRYTVFSLWDTYRNVHQMMTLLFPDRQLDMVRSMIDIYKEHGWLPKWELFGRETLTMEGDPSIPVIVDTWMKGLRDFDVETAYKAMYKSAATPGKNNLLRPDIDNYIAKGYCPMESQYDNSVSHALEYYIADYALSTFAKALGKENDAKKFFNYSMGYKNYYCKDFGTLRPITQDGKFYSPFNPKQGENFEPSPGFHEGNAWNYTFYVPHDVYGLAKLMGGKKNFVNKLQDVFDRGNYDPANEPDIAYPYLFSYFKGEEWRTQKIVKELLAKYYRNEPWGIPGNDDTGTMSAWAVFSMMGFYPDCPGVPQYTFTTPTFNKVTIRLDKRYYKNDTLTIETKGRGDYIKSIAIDGKKYNGGFRVNHKDLANAQNITFELTDRR